MVTKGHYLYIYISISFPHWVPNGLFLGANKLVGPVSMKKQPPWNEHFSHLEIGWLEDDILSIWISAYFCGVNWLFVSGDWSNAHLNGGCIFFPPTELGDFWNWSSESYGPASGSGGEIPQVKISGISGGGYGGYGGVSWLDHTRLGS